MRFSPAFLDELRARLPVSTVVGRKVRLKKQGREWRGLSPFTSEKTPSFYVNDHKGRWFDFSAGKNGNVFDFLMETEGLSFPEAVEKLAGEAGLALPVMSREDIARDARRATTLDAMEAAAAFFQMQLEGRAGERARAYLSGRGIDEGLQRAFRIGFAPREKSALRDYLRERGFGLDLQIEGGLLIHGEDIEVPYDRFRDRVMFPIGDRSGRTVAFGGRALDPAAPAKYLNSPETALFHKGACLFNHHRARASANGRDRVIAVEGYIDVLAMEAAGFPETVAPLGTALTTDQCALLWSMSPEPILCFDGDTAGQKAAGRAIETVLPLLSDTRTLRFALLPFGLDPDDLLRAQGPAALERVIAGALPLVEVLWRRERDARTLDTPEARTGLLGRLDRIADVIADPPLRRAYQSELKGRAFEHFRQIRPSRPGGGPASLSRPAPDRRSGLPISDSLARSPLFGAGSGGSLREAVILTSLVNAPELIAPHIEEIATVPLRTPDADRLRHVLVSLTDGDEAPSRGEIDEAIDAAGCRPAADRLAQLAGPALLRGIAAVDGGRELDAAVALRQALALQLNGPALNTSLQAALHAYNADPSERNWQVLRDVRARASSKEGLEATVADPSGPQPIEGPGR